MSEAAFYLNNSWPLLPIELEHQKSVLKIQEKIDNLTNSIGSQCAQIKPFDKDIQLKDSGYLTKWKKIEEVLGDLSSENTEVLKFLRFLITGIHSQEYTDETKFPIAPKGFATDMQKFYSSDAIQKCHDEDPKSKAITKTIKEAFTAGWKYPQAIQIWKDAWALLMYRSSQIIWSGTNDPAKEAQIQNLIQAQK